jgi:hypothetical protein
LGARQIGVPAGGVIDQAFVGIALRKVTAVGFSPPIHGVKVRDLNLMPLILEECNRIVLQ